MSEVSSRVAAIDVARGVAIVAMAAYHLTWDLAYFGVIAGNIPFTPPMRAASHLIGGAFLALVGVSLALSQAQKKLGRSFWRRTLTIAAAAALVSAATYAVAPSAPIFFGILHCILAASLIGGLLLLAPPAAALGVGALLIVGPFVFSSPHLNAGALVWLGLGTEEPPTLDWRPVAPWAGVTHVSLGLARYALPRLRASRLARWRPQSAPGRWLGFAGRHSLAIYLLHQPLLIGLAFAGAHLSGASQRQATERYLATCRPACVEAGGEIDACARACACVVRNSVKAGLAETLGAANLSAGDRGRLGAIVDQCGAEPD